MYPTSALFQASIATAPVVVSASVYRGGALIANNLNVLGGSVQIDADAAIRRRCTITIEDATGALLPHQASDVLAPYGNEIVIYRGLKLSTGNEMVPLGVFRIANPKVSDTGTSRTVTIQGYDRSRAIARARFEQPYVIAAGTNYATAITGIWSNRVANLPAGSIASTTLTTPLTVFQEGDGGPDPWQASTELATALGWEAFFDVTGAPVLRAVPDQTSQAIVASFVSGAGATMTSVDNDLSDDPGYNVFVAIGEPVTGAPVRSVAADTNPTSPTYVSGAYGRVPTFLRTPYITTQAQADAAAAAGLLGVRGGTEQVSISAVTNPALDVNDVVRVTRPQINVDDFYVIDAMNIPLDTRTAMTITTRKRRATAA